MKKDFSKNTDTKLCEEIEKDISLKILHQGGYPPILSASYELSQRLTIKWDDNSGYVYVRVTNSRKFIIGYTLLEDELPSIICSFLLE